MSNHSPQLQPQATHVTPRIAIDWGITRLRALLLSANGTVLASEEHAFALLEADRDGISACLARIVGRWPEAASNVLLAGMIGSASGWREVSQIATPATPAQLVDGAARDCIGGSAVTMLPGIRSINGFGDADVARGEEVAAVGLASTVSAPTLFVNCPGMHAKWMLVGPAGIATFHTAMTVELATTLARGGILAAMLHGAPGDGPAFRRGLAVGRGGGAVTRHLFAIRANVLAGRLEAADASSFLWGLLIGADVADAMQLHAWEGNVVSCVVAGAEPAASLYSAALTAAGIVARRLDYEALTAAGFTAILSAEKRDAD